MHVGHSTKSPEKLLKLVILRVAGEDQLIILCHVKYFAIHFQRITFRLRSNRCGSPSGSCVTSLKGLISRGKRPTKRLFQELKGEMMWGWTVMGWLENREGASFRRQTYQNMKDSGARKKEESSIMVKVSSAIWNQVCVSASEFFEHQKGKMTLDTEVRKKNK